MWLEGRGAWCGLRGEVGGGRLAVESLFTTLRTDRQQLQQVELVTEVLRPSAGCVASGKSQHLSGTWFLSLYKRHKNNLLQLPLRGKTVTD